MRLDPSQLRVLGNGELNWDFCSRRSVLFSPPLSGFAWSEDIGWISFSCQNSISCGAVNYGVTIVLRIVIPGLADHVAQRGNPAPPRYPILILICTLIRSLSPIFQNREFPLTSFDCQRENHGGNSQFFVGIACPLGPWFVPSGPGRI